MTKNAFGNCVSVGALAADQTSKAFVVANAEALANVFSVSGFNLIFHRNNGVSIGLLQGVPWWALAGLTTAIVVFLAISMIRAVRTAEAIAYGIVIGGFLGNVIDRVRFGGATDFLNFYVGITHWPAFNLADVFVVCGVGLLLIVAGRERAGSKETSG